MQNKEQHSIDRFAVFFVKRLRLANPWNYKAPLLISFPYFIFLLSNYRGFDAFFAILASIFVIIGVAGLGYLTNDLGDREKDALIKKENVLIGMPTFTVLFLFLLFFMLSILPWVYLPFGKISTYLLVVECVLFFVYAFPPFRFKERGVLGIYTDTLYAHVIPAVLSSFTFYLFTGMVFYDFPFFIVLIFSWQLIQGIRNIMFHQISDVEFDYHSGTRTFVSQVGPPMATRVVKRLLLPVEVILFSVFLLFVAIYWQHIWLVIFALAFFLTTYIIKRKEIPNMDYRARAYAFLDDFYTQWLPLIVLTELCFSSIHYVSILILHVLIFKNGIKSIVYNKFSLK